MAEIFPAITGLVGVAFFILLAIVAVLGFFLPFFVYRIHNEVAVISSKLNDIWFVADDIKEAIKKWEKTLDKQPHEQDMTSAISKE